MARINLLLFAFAYIFSATAAAQEITKSEIAKFKIRAITTIDDDGEVKYTCFYNAKGNVIQQASLDSAKMLVVDRQWFYDDSSRLIEEHVYTSYGDTARRIRYFYNDLGQLVKKESIASGTVNDLCTYEYDDKGNKITETQHSGTKRNSLTRFTYNADGRLSGENKVNDLIGKEETVNYTYNPQGQLIEKKIRFHYFNTTITVKYSYNEAGKLIKQFEKSSNGVSSTTTYEYNDQGLLIGDTFKSSLAKTRSKTSYQISFQ